MLRVPKANPLKPSTQNLNLGRESPWFKLLGEGISNLLCSDCGWSRFMVKIWCQLFHPLVSDWLREFAV